MSRNPETATRAKRNRAELTSAEDKLWSLLRGRRFHGAKFRRQHAIGPYVVDFACVAVRLVIEVDGPSHDTPEQITFDTERSALLAKAGWRVLRLTNTDVFANLEGAAELIDRALGD